MKNFYVSVISIVLTVFSSIQFSYQLINPNSARFQTTKSGRQLHDNFYKIIESRAPIEEALNQALTWDVVAQYEHFELLQEHVENNDKYAEYCQKVINGAQKLLNKTLERLRIGEKIDIRDYIKGLYDFEERRPVSKKMEEIVTRINDYRNAVIKKLEAEQVRARAEAAAKAQQVEAQTDDRQVEAESNAQQAEVETNDQQAVQDENEEANQAETQDGDVDEDQLVDESEEQDEEEIENSEAISTTSQSI